MASTAPVIVQARDARPVASAAQVAAISRWLGEPRWLWQRRLEALMQYAEAPWPERVEQRWRFTDPQMLLPAGPLAEPTLLEPAALPSVPPGGAAIVVQSGMRPRGALSPDARRAGMQVLSIGELQAERDRLGTALPSSGALFEALGAAIWSAGVAVLIPAGAVIPGPIRIVVPAGGGTTATRVLVVAESDAQLTVVEEHGGGALGVSPSVLGNTELLLGAGARLRYVLLEQWRPEVTGYLSQRARVERDASLMTVFGTFGGARAKLDLGADLVGAGAASELIGFALGEGRQHVDHHLVQHHVAPRTRSHMDVKVAVGGRARAATTGLIRIDEGSLGSEATQQQRNLLLSPRSRADSIPELEILNSDVQCSHGATSAPVDPSQLFYLHSRGVPPAEALRLVVRGFFEHALRRVPDGLRPAVEQQLEERIARVGGGAR